METSISLPTLIPGELIFALLVILFLAIYHIRKQRAQIKKLLEKFHELKAAYGQHAQEPPVSFYDAPQKIENPNTLDNYFGFALGDSLQRYEKHTSSTTPRMNHSHSYSGKVAALRSIYLAAEKEVFEELGITHAGWGILEKRLADLVHWGDKDDSQAEKVNALQEEITTLREHQKKQEEYQKRLEDYQMESQRTINNLSNMLNQLKYLQEGSPLGRQTDSFRLWGDDSLDKFIDSSNERNQKITGLLQDLKHYPAQFSPALQKKMADQLNILEIELMKSDQYIGNLKKQLHDARLQITNYAQLLRDIPPDNSPATTPSAIHPIDLNHALANEQAAHDNILGEIQQLKKNNQHQRSIIHELEQEIHNLRTALDTSDSPEQRHSKEEEIQRLERLVKECHTCINTLESEVEALYTRLREKAAVPNSETPLPDNSDTREELTMITRELEKTVAHYQQLHAINYLIMDFMKCTSIEQVGKQLVQFIKTFHPSTGFVISSSLGKAEYFPARYFNAALKHLVVSSTSIEPVSHLNEGTLFTNPRIQVMQLPSAPDVYPVLETSLGSLINAAEESIKRIESEKSKNKSGKQANTWTDHIKNLLSNLDIQYAYLVEENRKTFNHFIAELRRAYHLLELQGPGAIALDNAINEFEERIHSLIHGSEVIDRDISLLREHVEKLDIGQ